MPHLPASAPGRDQATTASPEPTRPAIQQLAWRVFAPIDLAINVVINGGIAWWLFAARPAVPLTGPAGLTAMVLPMTLILATVTTFCGFFNAVRERRSGRATPPLSRSAPWALRAVAEAVATGLGAWLVATALALGLAAAAPAATLGPVAAVLAITMIAGLLGFLLHGRAVSRGGRLH